MAIYYPPFEDLAYYCCPLMKPRELHQESPGLEIFATATLLSVDDRRFLVTARHVADELDQTHVLYPKNAEEAPAFTGPRIRTNPQLEATEPPFSNLDVAVLDLGDNPIHERYRFLGVGQLGRNEPVPDGIRCLVTGYRSGANKTRRNSPDVQAKQECFVFSTLDPGRYESYGLHPKLHLALVHEREVVTNKGQKIKPPPMNGMSGGGMWIDTGSGFALTAITSDHLASDRIVFGSRISVALELIRNL